MNQAVPVVNLNVKDTIIRGLQKKVDELGTLNVPFELSKNFPARETMGHTNPNHLKPTRRIVVKRLSNTIHTPAVGLAYDGGFDENGDYYEELGWEDENLIEISVWTTTHEDRDNIVELIKMWMIELEQDVLEDGQSYLSSEGVSAVTFIRAYEDESHQSAQLNGPIYIASLVYEVMSRFHFRTEEEWIQYKVQIRARLQECIIKVELDE